MKDVENLNLKWLGSKGPTHPLYLSPAPNLIVFYMMAILAFHESIKTAVQPPETNLNFHFLMQMYFCNQKPHFHPVNST